MPVMKWHYTKVRRQSMNTRITERGSLFTVTVQKKNLELAGLTEEDFKNPEKCANHIINLIEKDSERKACAAVCISAEGLFHIHVAIVCPTTTIKKIATITYNSHTEIVHSKNKLLKYMKKEPPYDEKGEQVLYTKNLEILEKATGGKRTDLGKIPEYLDQGLTPDQIFELDFSLRRYEKMIVSEYMARKYRQCPIIRDIKVTWIFGKAGTGKTLLAITQAYEKYEESDVYKVNDYQNGGFDYYRGEACLILDEFRGIDYKVLLSLLDKYRGQIHCRFSNVYALFTEVYITTIYSPEEVYEFMVDDRNKSIDSYAQLIRRINAVTYTYISGNDYKTLSISSKEYKNRADIEQKVMQQDFISVDDADITLADIFPDAIN